MIEIASIYGVKIYVDAAAQVNEAWLLKEDQVAIYKKIRELQQILASSGVRLTNIGVVAS